MVEELLDRIVERGFLTMGEVRDAVSRNHLKQPDCASLGDFFRGDAVLRLDREMAISLDGVYEQGDFYQRWIQRFSLVAFGTFLGRCLTKYLAIPFGGAVVILIVAEHLVYMVTCHEVFYVPTWSKWKSYDPTLVVGCILFGLIHVPRFRTACWELLKLAGQTGAPRLLRLVPLAFRPAAGAIDPGQSGRPVRLPLCRQAASADARYLANPAEPSGSLADDDRAGSSLRVAQHTY